MKKLSLFFLMAFAAIAVANAQEVIAEPITVQCGDQIQLQCTPQSGYHAKEWQLFLEKEDGTKLNETGISLLTLTEKKAEDQSATNLNKEDIDFKEGVIGKITGDNIPFIAQAEIYHIVAICEENGVYISVIAGDNGEIASDVQYDKKDVKSSEKPVIAVAPLPCYTFVGWDIKVYLDAGLTTEITELAWTMQADNSTNFDDLFEIRKDQDGKEMTGESGNYQYVIKGGFNLQDPNHIYPEQSYIVLTAKYENKVFKVKASADNTNGTTHSATVTKINETEQPSEE